MLGLLQFTWVLKGIAALEKVVERSEGLPGGGFRRAIGQGGKS